MDGLLLVDKPSGMTSHDVVSGIRKILKTKQVGHAGTLDPLASGLLVCLVGEGTKLSNYIMAGVKTYRVGVRFGTTTDSLDITGEVLSKNAVSLSQDQIVQAALGLQGDLELEVPLVSAIKVQGKKLYEYAREGKAIDAPLKKMTIHGVSFLDARSDWALFDLVCSKGTYVRSWAFRLGGILGCGACVDSLIRLSSGPFNLKSALDFKACVGGAPIGEKSFISMEEALKGWITLRVKGRDEKLIRNGQIPMGFEAYLRNLHVLEAIRVLDEQGKLLALLAYDGDKGEFKISRVFRTLQS